MMKKLLAALLGVSGIVVVTILFTYFSSSKKNPDKEYRIAFKKNYKIFAPKIPKSLNFAGESVPIDTFYVRESLDGEISVNTYFHSSTLSLIKRAYRWFPVIEPILKTHNIPDDFKYLALIESGFLNVKSPAGAAGFWQFLKPTARELGLEVTRKKYTIKIPAGDSITYQKLINQFDNEHLIFNENMHVDQIN